MMKNRVLSLVCALMFSLVATAQGHLSFMGIPIAGNLYSFCQKLKTKGFSQVGYNKEFRFFKGDFTGRKASVGVGATVDGRFVHTVVVLFEPTYEWDALVSTYEYQKAIYTMKYGDPCSFVENTPGNVNSNAALMVELGKGTVDYKSMWRMPEGTIELYIEKAPIKHKGNVCIRYRDSKNLAAQIQSDINDI